MVELLYAEYPYAHSTNGMRSLGVVIVLIIAAVGPGRKPNIYPTIMVYIYEMIPNTPDGSWNDLNCGDGRNFICKKNYDSVGPITHAPTTPASGYCPYNSVKFLNRCYIYFGTDPSARLSWKDARDECKKTPGTELATIHSQQVQGLF